MIAIQRGALLDIPIPCGGIGRRNTQGDQIILLRNIESGANQIMEKITIANVMV